MTAAATDHQTATAEHIAAVFSRDPVDSHVVVVDGYGVRVHVNRGHLIIEDGIGPHRRQRRYSRADRTLRRLVILADTGNLTLDALRWCADLGVAVIHIDRNARLLSVSGDPGINDPRLRRAQAAAAASPVGLEVTKALLGSKLDGQAAVAEQLGAATIAGTIRDLAQRLRSSDHVAQGRELEAKASNVYFGAWSTSIQCQFAQRDADRVPEHWWTFATRGSPLHKGGRSARGASNPVNALLNYSYTLAEAECRLAALALGLDPGLGIVHTDKRDRDSLALDLLEPLRPIAERHLALLLQTRHFRANDFHETRQGACRLLAPLTHQLAQWMPTYAQAVAAHAETVAHTVADSSPGDIALRTPLSRANTKRQQSIGNRSANRKPATDPVIPPTCRNCGIGLSERSRQLCSACWPVTRQRLATERNATANNALAARRAAGEDPTNTPAAAAKRSQSLAERKHEESGWRPSAEDSYWTRNRYQAEILPALAAVPLSAMMRATSLSVSACSRIRSGQLIPHQRHWGPLREVGMGFADGIYQAGEAKRPGHEAAASDRGIADGARS